MAVSASEVQKAYLAYFGRPADPLGLTYWQNAASIDAVKAGFAGSAEYASLYSGMNSAARVNQVYQNVLGRAAEPAGLTYWAAKLDACTLTVADLAWTIINAAQNEDAVTVANRMTYAAAFTAAVNTTDEIIGYSGDAAAASARAAVLPVTTNASLVTAQASIDASVQAAAAAGNASSGQTYTLTTGVDTFTGTAGNDAFSATQLTLTSLDTLDGAGGTDTLTVSDASAAALTLPTAITVKNIENLVVNHSSDAAIDDLVADVQGWTGLQSLNLKHVGTAATMTAITTKANVTTATLTNVTTVGITDNAAAASDTLATVNVVGNTGLVTIDSEALRTLSLKDSSGGATVTATTNSHALAVTLNNMTAGTITDTKASSLSVTTTGAATTGGTITTVAATSATIAADEALALTALNVAAATKLTVTGDSLVTLGGANFTALTSIDASAQTAGGVDIKAIALGTGVTFTGGAGADSIQLGATTKAITLGAGNDRVALTAAVTALGAGGSIDAGAGTSDTLAFLDADDAGTATATTTFAGTISNFEVLELAGAAGGAVTVDLANLDNISQVKMTADVAGGLLTLNNLASGGQVSYTVAQTAATTVGVTSALAGSADVANVAVSAAAGINVNTLTIANVETVNFATDDTAATPTSIQHTAALVDTAVKTITVTGDAGLALTTAGATAVTSFDASGVTAGAVSWTSAALTAASTVKGGAGNDTLILTAATVATNLSGGAGNDTLTVTNALNNTIDGGDGNDAITVGNGNNTITAGAGNDTIVLGSGMNTVDVGAGTDGVTLVVPVNGNAYSTITGLGSTGDSLTLVDQGTEVFTAAKVTQAETAAFRDYLDAAAAGDGSLNANIKWFQYGGNTYVVEDLSAANSFADGVDLVVKLTGLVDLSTAGAAGNVITLA